MKIATNILNEGTRGNLRKKTTYKDRETEEGIVDLYLQKWGHNE